MNESQSSTVRATPWKIAFAFLITAVVIGASAALFLLGLELVTQAREAQGLLFLLAPVVGALTSFAYLSWAPETAKGTNLIASLLRKSETPIGEVPAKMAPLIVLATWLSHLAGLSVGREGTAVQMGAALTRNLRGLFPRATPRLEHLLLLSGVAAGFGAVFGVPIAGAIFAMELAGKFSRETWRTQAWPDRLREFAIAFAVSSIADLTARGLGAHHTPYPAIPPLEAWFSFNAIGGLLTATIAFGVIAWLFLKILHQFKIVWSKLIRAEKWRPIVGGALFAPMAFAPTHWRRFAGLGVSEITGSFTHVMSFFDPLLKLLLTVFSIGCGFKGGEVTPLFFIGATAGSALAGLWNLPPALLASLGVVAVFGAAAEVPLACAIMAGELFGFSCVPAALFTCYFAAKICRHPGLYEV